MHLCMIKISQRTSHLHLCMTMSCLPKRPPSPKVYSEKDAEAQADKAYIGMLFFWTELGKFENYPSSQGWLNPSSQG